MRKAISNDGYMVHVKTDAMKTVEIKCNKDLSSFQLQFIINFVVTERKLAHGPVKFPVCSIIDNRGIVLYHLWFD